MQTQLLSLLKDLFVTSFLYQPSDILLDELQGAFRVKSRVGSSLGVAAKRWQLFSLGLLEGSGRHLLHRHIIAKVCKDADGDLSELRNFLQLAKRLHWLRCHASIIGLSLLRSTFDGPGARSYFGLETFLFIALFDGAARSTKPRACLVYC